MKIYQGLTVRSEIGSEFNVHGVLGGIVFWGAYDAGGECVDLYRSTVADFTGLVEKIRGRGAAIYSLLDGQPEAMGAMVGVRDHVHFLVGHMKKPEPIKPAGPRND